MLNKADLRQIKALADGNWRSILLTLAPGLQEAIEAQPKHVKCPIHGGANNDALRVFSDFDETGGVICNSCGGRSDGIETLKWVNGWNTIEAFQAVADSLGYEGGKSLKPRQMKPPPPKKPTKEELEEQRKTNEKRTASLLRTWREGLEISDPKARLFSDYLAHRGLGQIKESLDIRLHPALPYYHHQDGEYVKVGTFPAILTMLRSSTSAPLTLHRTYLSKEGRKADIKEGGTKKLMSAPLDMKITGGAVYLDPPAPRVAIAEGLETALAVRQVTKLSTQACCTATLLESYEPAPVVSEVLIFADLDASHAGQRAAEKLASRLLARGVDVKIFYPPGPIVDKGVDWLDAFVKLGHAAFPNYVQPPTENTAYSVTDFDETDAETMELYYGRMTEGV